MEALKEFGIYFVTGNGNIFGISEDGVEYVYTKIIDSSNITEFFKKGEDIYFSVKTKSEAEETINYKQSNGKLEEIHKLPKKPVHVRTQIDNSNFKIENFDYEGTLYSDVTNKIIESGIERFILVDEKCYIKDYGMIFNVSEGRGTIREPGLYFWPSNKSCINKILNKGTLWT